MIRFSVLIILSSCFFRMEAICQSIELERAKIKSRIVDDEFSTKQSQIIGIQELICIYDYPDLNFPLDTVATIYTSNGPLHFVWVDYTIKYIPNCLSSKTSETNPYPIVIKINSERVFGVLNGSYYKLFGFRKSESDSFYSRFKSREKRKVKRLAKSVREKIIESKKD